MSGSGSTIQQHPAIYFDPTSPYSGSGRFIGTPEKPVNDIDDAITLARNRRINRVIILKGDVVPNVDLDGITFVGASVTSNSFDLNAQTYEKAFFEKLSLYGDATGDGVPDRLLEGVGCRLAYHTHGSLDNGGVLIFRNSVCGAGDINCRLLYLDGAFADDRFAPVLPQKINADGVHMIGCKGVYEIDGLKFENPSTFVMVGGKLIFGPGVELDSQVRIFGDCIVEDNSGDNLHIQYYTLQQGAKSLEEIYDIVEEIDLGGVTTYDGVYLDTIDGDPGTDYPLGNPEHPVNNLPDALTILAATKRRKIYLRGSLVPTMDIISNLEIIRYGEYAGIDLNNKRYVNVLFNDVVVSGEAGEPSNIQMVGGSIMDSSISGMFHSTFSGVLMVGTIEIDFSYLQNCSSLQDEVLLVGKQMTCVGFNGEAELEITDNFKSVFSGDGRLKVEGNSGELSVFGGLHVDDQSGAGLDVTDFTVFGYRRGLEAIYLKVRDAEEWIWQGGDSSVLTPNVHGSVAEMIRFQNDVLRRNFVDVLTASGSEQIVYNYESEKPWGITSGWINLVNLEDGDKVVIKVMVKPHEDDDYQLVVPSDKTTFEDEQPEGEAFLNIKTIEGVYGIRITLEQVAGVNRDYRWNIMEVS